MRLDERCVKNLSFIKEAGDYLVEVETYQIKKPYREDMVYTWDCGYIDKENLEKLKSFVENETQILKGDFLAKVNVYKVENEDYETVEIFYPKRKWERG